MSSGKIGMIFTYVKHKPQNATTPSPTAPPVSSPKPILNRPLNYTRMNRITNVSMHNIIHKPASGCSSCGN